ncbi:hypothetical protein [Leuconostoc suionicum]|uniref:hypothetical protein n=1 Tax=Leuconostoc suionicum TaxID=1511761 RepID=UPI0024ACBC70|nr:hypothetical protein [Leuconostoc suionicum]MDI6651104.1 hypothetical protein [Leuconostoc suionicum]
MMKNPLVISFLIGTLILGLTIGFMGNLIYYTGFAILAVTILLFIVTRLLARYINQIPFIRILIGVSVGLVLMVLVQVLVLSFMPNTVYHDPYRVLSQADQMAANHMTWDITYFWRYSNNVPLAYLMSLWLRVTQFFSLSTNISIHLLSVIVLDTFIVLVLYTAYQLNRRNSTVVGLFSFFALTPFAYTYYLQVFYSDLPSMLILVIVLRIIWSWSTKSVGQKIISGSGLVISVLVGALIKPNIIVIIPALAVVALILFVKKRLNKSQIIIPILLIIFGFGLSIPTTRGIYFISNYTPKTEFELPTTHWMMVAFNSKNNGMYSGSDVIKDNNQPNKSARQVYDLKQIVTRIKKMGMFGLIKLWVVKMGILLNVNTIQDWYNGGFRSAPTWYFKNAQLIRVLTKVSYTSATLCIWLTFIIKLFRWRVNLDDVNQLAALLAIVIVLGYLSFHTLLWEVEPRYGQVILPLIMFTISAIPNQLVNNRKEVRTQKNTLFGVILLISTIASGLIFSKTVGETKSQNLVVSAQRSQLSSQYGAKPEMLVPNTMVTEDVDINTIANYFSVQIHNHSNVNVFLRNIKTKEDLRFHVAGTSYRLWHLIKPGHYQIVVFNNTPKSQPIDIVRTYHYRLNNYSLIINGKSNPTASLVFKTLVLY